MRVESENDFVKVRDQIQIWKRRFPMFRHDVNEIETIIENHIRNYSLEMVLYRQTHRDRCLEDAAKEIEKINRVLSTVEKLELMALLSQG